jgi:hypothetical protein
MRTPLIRLKPIVCASFGAMMIECLRGFVVVLFFLFCSMQQASLAQGQKVSSALTATPREMYLKKAKADLAEYSAKFEVMIRDREGYAPCEVEKTRLFRDYANWYVTHEKEVWTKVEQFKADSQMMNDALFIDQKFNALLNANVETVPSSSASRTEMRFMDLVSYLGDLSVKKRKSIDRNELDVFRAQSMDPLYSPYQIGLVDLVETLKVMTNHMNASLLERGVSFEAIFEDRAQDYFLGLVIKYQLLQKEVRVDLLSQEGRISVMDGIALGALHTEVLSDSKPIDAQLRYVEFFKKHSQKRCLPRILAQPSMHPYLTVGDLLVFATKAVNYYDQIKDGGSVHCHLGTTGKIQFNARKAQVYYWGGAWGDHSNDFITLENASRIGVKWAGHYGAIWIDFGQEDEEGRFKSSHGPAICK